MSYVIAVSAPVGGGKTTLVQGLCKALGDATAIHFDHYETLSEHPPADIRRWMRKGANIDELVVEKLPEHLAHLKSGNAVTDPTGLHIRAAKHICFETPFARQHRATGALVDMAIWIETPLDVALARNLKELGRQPGADSDLSGWLAPYLDSYLDFVRDLLVMQQEVVGGAADLVLDGLDPVDDNVERAAREVRGRWR